MEADLFENLKILLLKLNQILAIQKSLKHKPTSSQADRLL